MEYRKMGNTGVSPSLLGFGCMRFPTSNGKIDEAEAERMLDRAIGAGVTYLDTAYPYHNGDSEPFVGRILKKYDRSSLYLATKLPMWKIKTLEDAKETFEEQLKRLDVDYVDFYLLHALDGKRWERAQELKLLEYCEQLKKEGKIRWLGFSFHDDYEAFEKILTGYGWDFCQIQYNYVDTDIQAGDKGYELAEKLGIPMVIMEPVKGGSLAALPADITAPFRTYAPDASDASWALRWVASKPNVKVVLSGMSTMEQVEDNLKTFERFRPFNEEEAKIAAQVAQTIKGRTKNGCTGCAYCMPCPFGIDIPRNFHIWNEYARFGNEARARQRYYVDTKPEARADQCRKCGKCEMLCPQSLPIRADLERVAADMPKPAANG